MPKVSIITPCYNGARFVEKTIASVRAQSFTDWEHILVDDGSTDNSAQLIAGCVERDSRLKLIRQPNGGVSNARNNGFKACSKTSIYIYFPDADDCLDPEMLEVMVNYLDKHTQVGLAYCDYDWIDEHDRFVEKTEYPRYAPSAFRVRCLPHSEPLTPFVSVFCWAPVMENVSVLRRSVFEQTPGWDENLGQIGESVDLFLHFALISEIHFVPRRLYKYRQHGGQATAIKSRIGKQKQKVTAKWLNMPGLGPTQQKILRDAYRFQIGLLKSYQMLLAAREHWKKREFEYAARNVYGAGRSFSSYVICRLRGKV